ncbi:MAG: hypothetical protein GY771_00660 [bacterium]|nr:hypothetical protein [bacterium]
MIKCTIFLILLAFFAESGLCVDIYYLVGAENDMVEIHKYSTDDETSEFVFESRSAFGYDLIKTQDGRIGFSRQEINMDTYTHKEESTIYDPATNRIESIEDFSITDARDGKYLGTFDYGWQSYLDKYKNGAIKDLNFDPKNQRIVEVDATTGSRKKFTKWGGCPKYAITGNIIYHIYKGDPGIYIIDKNSRELTSIKIPSKYTDKEVSFGWKEMFTAKYYEDQIVVATNYYLFGYKYSEHDGISITISEPEGFLDLDFMVETIDIDNDSNVYILEESWKSKKDLLILNIFTRESDNIDCPNVLCNPFVVLP